MFNDFVGLAFTIMEKNIFAVADRRFLFNDSQHVCIVSLPFDLNSINKMKGKIFLNGISIKCKQKNVIGKRDRDKGKCCRASIYQSD